MEYKLQGVDTSSYTESQLKKKMRGRRGIILDVTLDSRAELELRRLGEAGANIIANSSQYNEYELRRISVACLEGGGKLYLVDTGDKNVYGLQRIIDTGANIYIPDATRNIFELIRMAQKCTTAKTRMIIASAAQFNAADLNRLIQAGAVIETSIAEEVEMMSEEEESNDEESEDNNWEGGNEETEDSEDKDYYEDESDEEDEDDEDEDDENTAIICPNCGVSDAGYWECDNCGAKNLFISLNENNECYCSSCCEYRNAYYSTITCDNCGETFTAHMYELSDPDSEPWSRHPETWKNNSSEGGREIDEEVASIEEEIEDPQSKIGRIFERLNAVAETSLECIVSASDYIFAQTDGRIIEISSALVNYLDDDELAWVISHEISHVVKEHLEKKQDAINKVGAQVKETWADKDMGFLGKLFVSGITIGASYFGIMFLSRSHELEADSIALELMGEAGFDSQAADSALAKIGGSSGGGLTDTHPSTYSRISNMQRKRR